jgi:glycine dehydrogenase subunit 1
MSYILNTEDDVRAMLERIGAGSVERLFDAIPEDVRLGRPLDVPPALSELALTQELTRLAGRNLDVSRFPCFLGGGAYDHFIPAAVDQLAGRGEFYTAYTPYQAEASQGTLQAIFEYQTLVAELTGMELSNASLYEGGSAIAEAVIMAAATNDRPRVVVAGTVHPEYRQTLATLTANLELDIVAVPPGEDGRVAPGAVAAALGNDAGALVIQQPNFFGLLEEAEALVGAARAAGAASIVSVDPISLGLLRRPGDYGADIVVAEGQALGNTLGYGGPYLGLLACGEAFLRKLPGRIVGQTTDRRGKRCWVLTLQTREQHIRREKATSNICTNQGLMALRASIYLALLGPGGLRDAAELCTRKAHYAAERLANLPRVELAFDAPFFKEFAVRVKGDPEVVLAEVLRRGYHGGIALGRWYPEHADAILVAVTEKRTREEIDGLVEAYAGAVGAAR